MDRFLLDEKEEGGEAGTPEAVGIRSGFVWLIIVPVWFD